MGGSAILNPEGRYYQHLKSAFEADCEGNYWAEEIMFMERNRRDFVTRIERINDNAEAICNVLQAHLLVKDDLVSGKNFALTLPYVVLAYYWELDWAAGFRHVSGAASH
ncbi:hypothetical protein F5882DRAFT_469177 [Hyaloscypha sp. PMI_1271]|nr:hypothetical protein F5882DRAFT_469177 [Hyaloscypha sp. PMI_1271]